MINIIYFCYMCFFCLLILTNSNFFAYKFFLYALVPASLCPIEIYGYSRFSYINIPNFKFDLANTYQTITFMRSSIFLGLIVFMVSIIFTSSISPNFSVYWFLPLFEYFTAIVIFVLVTARLASDVENFYRFFLTYISFILAVNAAINIYNFFHNLEEGMSFVNYRLSPTFGYIPDHHPVTAALTYLTGLVAAIGVLTIKVKPVEKFLVSISAATLFIILCLTQSRGALLAGIVSTFVMLMMSTHHHRKYIAFFPFIGGLLFLLIPKAGMRALTRGDSQRFEVWRRFFDLSLNRPIFGHGERLEISVELSTGEKLGHAHNIFLSAFLRGGVVAFIGLLFAYVFALHRTYMFSRMFNNPIPIGIIVAIFVAGLFDFDQLVFLADWQWLSFWFSLGLAISCDHKLYL